MKPSIIATLALGLSLCANLQAQTPVAASPNWNRALPNGPDARVKITEEYAKLVARDAYFWTWPMVNIYNRRLVMGGIKEATKAGPLVFAPLQRANWLPAPKGDFSLYVRAYWPKPAVTDGSWTPPAVKQVK